MCGRFALFAPSGAIQKHFGLVEEVAHSLRYNIAPGQDVAAVRLLSTGVRRMEMMRWGLIPSWARDTKVGYRMINARSETLQQKPSFRGPFRTSRCLIPASGFYEWKKVAGQKNKQPFFITLKTPPPFVFAGLWSEWTSSSGSETIVSCTILTTVPNSLLAGIHNRMPVILPPELYNVWLDQQSRPQDLQKMLVPLSQDLMKVYPVSTLCNNARNDSANCVAPCDHCLDD